MSSVVSGVTGGLGNFGGGNGGLGFLTGTGQNSGIMGLGQYHTDPYAVNGAAFAPDAAEQQYTQGLQGAVAGNGPSVAEMQMRRGVDQANAQAQSFAASQRGISPALAARLGAQQQSNMAQNANANAAMMRTQEQLDARGALGQELQSQRTGRMGLENLNSGNFNYAQGLNLQGYANAAGHRADFMGGMMNGGGGMMSMMGGAGGGMVPDPASFNHTPGVPSLAAPNAAYNKGQKAPAKQTGGPKSGQGAPAGAKGAYSGPGAVPYASANIGYAQGGVVSRAGRVLAQQPVQRMAIGGEMQNPMGAMASFRNFNPQPAMPITPMPYGIAVKGEMPNQPQMLGDKSQDIKSSAQASPNGLFGMGGNRSFGSGGPVPGEAKISGDSFKNDKVPALLSPKEIVLPRSVTMAEDAPQKAAEFVAAVQARQKAKQRKAS